MFRTKKGFSLGTASAVAIAASLMLGGTAMAQVATSTIRGSITDNGAAEAGAAVVARDVASGFSYNVTTNANGGYVLSGLRPGTYEITATTSDGQSAADLVTIGVGQVGGLDLEVAGVDAGSEVDAIIVTGSRLVEVRTSEIATNVTTQQIETLPQLNRNFLNFAALAPGVRVSQNANEQTISAGGQRAEAVNAFIDGASLKSNVVDGGIAGQDDSRGNPFPQAAVQEFRVVTQNFKAEYEQASSAIITAVTRSGTNEFEGEIFGTYRDESFIEQDIFARRAGQTKPDLSIEQYGAAFGGPIIRDRLHFFGSYEHKNEGRAAVINLGRDTPAYRAMFGDELGTVAVPFEEDLYFGKLSWQPAAGHLVDFSVTYRDEADRRGVGGNSAVERSYDLKQETTSYNLRHQYQGDGWLNEFAISHRNYNYLQEGQVTGEPARNYNVFEDDQPGTPGFQVNYFGGIRVFNMGGNNSFQDITDEVTTIRNDLTFSDIEFNGWHTIKMGAKYSEQTYSVTKAFGGIPQFYYDLDGRPETSGDADVPYRVEVSNPLGPVELENKVIGLYIQDDWQVTDKLELNLGLRWDYESNNNNKNYVTPAAVVTAIDAFLAREAAAANGHIPDFFNRDDYISTGNNREAFKGQFQPRIGFSYDVHGDESTVIFGGAGRYYDRINFNFSFDEYTKPLQGTRNLFFSTTGRPAGENDPVLGLPGESNDPILWQSSYDDLAAMNALFGAAPARGEIFLLKNDFEPPMTDQFNLGVRQRFGDWHTEATLAYSRTENEFGWYLLNRNAEGGPNDSGGWGDAPPGFGNTLVSNHDKERRWKALYLKADKPYNEDDGWGVWFTYTLSKAEENGSKDNFAFDFYWIDTTPWRSSGNDERHRIVANGIVDLPLDFQLSGILTLGSGTPRDMDDPTKPINDDINAFWPDKKGFFIPDAWAYRQVDLRLTKDFAMPLGGELEVFLDAINVFNFNNYDGYVTYTGPAGSPNPNFGRPTSVYYPTRTFQIGARYKF